MQVEQKHVKQLEKICLVKRLLAVVKNCLNHANFKEKKFSVFSVSLPVVSIFRSVHHE